MRHNCFDCAYHRERYNRNGVLLGVDCAKDNMFFVEYDEAMSMRCGSWCEEDENDRDTDMREMRRP